MKKQYTLVLRGVLQDAKGRYLLMQRSSQSKGWPGKWEFPGGKVDRGEELTDALVREWKEETGLNVSPMTCLDVFDHEREHDRILYFVFRMRAKSFRVKKSAEHDNFGWFTALEMKKLDVSPVLKRVVDALCA
jgi:8-oxo-dGTP diphosphatase